MRFYINHPDHPWVRGRDGNFFLDIITQYSYARNVIANDSSTPASPATYEYTDLPMWWFGA